MSDTPKDDIEIPVERMGLAREFTQFIVHNALWWMIPIVVVLTVMVGLILFT